MNIRCKKTWKFSYLVFSFQKDVLARIFFERVQERRHLLEFKNETNCMFTGSTTKLLLCSYFTTNFHCELSTGTVRLYHTMPYTMITMNYEGQN